MLLAWASRPSTIAKRIMSSALSSNCFLLYSIMLVDLIKSLELRALKNLAVIPVGSV